MSDDRNPYPPAGQPDPAPATEPITAAAADPVRATAPLPDPDPRQAGAAQVEADMAQRLEALDHLYASGKITAAELREGRRRVLNGPEMGPPPFAAPLRAPAPDQAPAPPAAGSSGAGGAPPRQVVTEHSGPPQPPAPRKIAGLPVWGAVAIAAAIVAGLVVLAVVLLGGGGGSNSNTQASAGAPDYARQIGAPLNQLTASVVVVGKGLARVSEPGDLNGLHRLAERQIDAVEAARRTLSTLEVTASDRLAQQRLIAAAATQRRFLVQLGRATDGTPTQATLGAVNRTRRAGGETLAAYRRFFAVAKGAPDAITATDLTDTSGLLAAVQKALSAGAAPTGSTGSPAPAPGGTYGGGSFQSPTGNIHCQITESVLYCSTSNDGFGVSLPSVGSPSTWRFTAAGGVAVPYGSSWASGPFSCDSAYNGVTCRNQSGNGFFLNRDTYNPF